MNIPLFRGAGCNKVAKLCLGRRLDNIFTSTSSPTDYCTGSNNALTCTTGTVYNGAYHYMTQAYHRYRIQRCVSLCHTHTPGAFFPSPFARQPRGCQCRTTHLRKSLGKIDSKDDLLWHRNYPNHCRRYRARESRPRGGWCDKHRPMRCTMSTIINNALVHAVNRVR